MDIQFVKGAKNAWRWFSVQAMSLAVAIQGAWVFVPEDLRSGMPPNAVQAVTAVLLILGVAGRLVKQKESHEP